MKKILFLLSVVLCGCATNQNVDKSKHFEQLHSDMKDKAEVLKEKSIEWTKLSDEIHKNDSWDNERDKEQLITLTNQLIEDSNQLKVWIHTKNESIKSGDGAYERELKEYLNSSQMRYELYGESMISFRNMLLAKEAEEVTREVEDWLYYWEKHEEETSITEKELADVMELVDEK